MTPALHALTPASLARSGNFKNPDQLIGALRLAEIQWFDGLGKGSAAEWMGLSPAQHAQWQRGDEGILALARKLMGSHAAP